MKKNTSECSATEYYFCHYRNKLQFVREKLKQVHELNFELLSCLGKAGLYIFTFLCTWEQVTFFCCGFGNCIKVSANHLSNSMLSVLDIKISIAVLLRTITAYARVWTCDVNCDPLCSKLHNVCLIRLMLFFLKGMYCNIPYDPEEIKFKRHKGLYLHLCHSSRTAQITEWWSNLYYIILQ